MKQLNSINFYREWLNAVKNRKDEMLALWKNSRDVTYFIMGSENSIINKIANAFDLLAYEQDYYCIDTILYELNDLVPGIKPNTFWFRDIKVAFEHENKFNSGLYQEVSHLLLTNCDLKVLVTYPDYEPDAELAYLHSIIKGSKHSKEISDRENFLIVFGYENKFEWEGYLYKETNWQKIE